jgi:hypothetical protein
VQEDDDMVGKMESLPSLSSEKISPTMQVSLGIVNLVEGEHRVT